MREKLEQRGKRIDMLRFADNIAPLAGSEKELMAILKEMEDTFESSWTLEINKDQTKMLMVSRRGMGNSESTRKASPESLLVYVRRIDFEKRETFPI